MARHFSLLLLLLTLTRALKIFGTPGRGPAIQRMYPDNVMVKCDYWLGAGQLTSATVDNVRGLQKCVKVLSVAVYTDEEDFEGGRFGAASDAVCGAEYGTNSPERVTSPTATGTGTPGPAPSTSRSPDSARGPTSLSGCSSVASGPRRR